VLQADHFIARQERQAASRAPAAAAAAAGTVRGSLINN
jgi:hypothetical protein